MEIIAIGCLHPYSLGALDIVLQFQSNYLIWIILSQSPNKEGKGFNPLLWRQLQLKDILVPIIDQHNWVPKLQTLALHSYIVKNLNNVEN